MENKTTSNTGTYKYAAAISKIILQQPKLNCLIDTIR